MTRRTNRLVTVLSLALLSGLAHAQATVAPSRRSADVPPPAAERFEPDLDAWWQDAVFYELFVRSFADSTEGPLAGDGIGDLRGAIERLDYLNDGDPTTDTDLGVTAIWLMPITQSPSYHGYDTTDYYTVDQEYGTNEDFRAFVQACHERGIRVIIDLVLNHCSSEHHWFWGSLDPDSPWREFFVWSDGDPGYRGPWNQEVWHESPSGDGTYYYGLFWSGMPDLNYENEAVTRQMFDVLRFWLEDMDIDGFRLDAIRHLIEDGEQQDNTPQTHDWLRRFYREYKRLDPEAIAVGEVWAGSDVVSTYVGDQMDLAFEFDLGYRIVDGVRDGSKKPISEQMARIGELYPLGMYATFLRNHDQPRVMHELGADESKARLAAMIQLTLPGVPFVYYGEEIGMIADKPDPEIRTPMQWSEQQNAGFTQNEPWKAPKPDYLVRNVRAQSADAGSMLSLYRTLIDLRQTHEALRIGTFEEIDTRNDKILAYVRHLNSETLLCVFNLSGEPVDASTFSLDPSGTAARGMRPADGINMIDGRPLPTEALASRGGYVVRLAR